jgi:hypothetical protein
MSSSQLILELDELGMIQEKLDFIKFNGICLTQIPNNTFFDKIIQHILGTDNICVSSQ